MPPRSRKRSASSLSEPESSSKKSTPALQSASKKPSSKSSAKPTLPIQTSATAQHDAQQTQSSLALSLLKTLRQISSVPSAPLTSIPTENSLTTPPQCPTQTTKISLSALEETFNKHPKHTVIPLSAMMLSLGSKVTSKGIQIVEKTFTELSNRGDRSVESFRDLNWKAIRRWASSQFPGAKLVVEVESVVCYGRVVVRSLVVVNDERSFREVGEMVVRVLGGGEFRVQVLGGRHLADVLILLEVEW